MNYKKLLCQLIAHHPTPGKRVVWTSQETRTWTIKTLAWATEHLKPQELAILEARNEGLSYDQITAQTGKKREKLRQLEARALRKIRGRIRGLQDNLFAAVQFEIIPDGPKDPNWITVKQAQTLTEFCACHLRYLARTGKVISRLHPTNRAQIQLHKASLKSYVLRPAIRGRKKCIWKGE